MNIDIAEIKIKIKVRDIKENRKLEDEIWHVKDLMLEFDLGSGPSFVEQALTLWIENKLKELGVDTYSMSLSFSVL